MNDLIERLEKATGPDRELDAAIGKVLFGHHRIEHEAATNWDSSWSELVDGDGKPVQELLAYTSSVDAALTLVPFRAGWSVHGNTNIFYGVVFGHYSNAAPTPAIALCIAALKARAGSASRASIYIQQRAE